MIRETTILFSRASFSMRLKVSKGDEWRIRNLLSFSMSFQKSTIREDTICYRGRHFDEFRGFDSRLLKNALFIVIFDEFLKVDDSRRQDLLSRASFSICPKKQHCSPTCSFVGQNFLRDLFDFSQWRLFNSKKESSYKSYIYKLLFTFWKN
jgi:hypothetical protein